MTLRLFALVSFLIIPLCAQGAEAIPLSDFARHLKFKDVKISPDGTHLAINAIVDGDSVLSIVNIADNQGFSIAPREEDVVVDYWWVSDKRVLYTLGTKVGQLEQPVSTGELFAVNADGKGRDILFGYRANRDPAGSTGSLIQKKQSENASASMLDDLRDEDDDAIIAVRRWNWSHVKSAGGELLHPEVRKIDVRSGKNRTLTVSPLIYADFLTDNEGVARFTFGTDTDQSYKVYYRQGDGKDWELVIDEAKDGVRVYPVAFNRAGDGVYFFCGGDKGVGGLCLWNVANHSFKTLWSGSEASPISYSKTFDGKDIYAIRSMPGRTAVTLVDREAAESKLLAEMMGVFPGEEVEFTSNSKDGKKIIVSVEGDKNPGTYYLYDVDTKKLSLLLSQAPWLENKPLASMEPFSFKSRDGLLLHGYLSKPPGKEDARDLPMVVYLHGGPYEVRDTWRYNRKVQALTSRGYAVLQVNFRGSGGYGYDFVKAGYGEWGAKMQDDVTDATKWAIKQGVADPKRICTLGTSYGGYSALQAVVREPDLYQCAIGDAGVYDLNLMRTRGDIPQSLYGEAYLEKVLGKDSSVLAQRSPASQAATIKANVMLISGGEDKRVPPVHSEAMRNALTKNGAEVVWLYQPSEGHGYYKEENVTDMYEKIIAFLDQNIGPGK
ncbi:alpha/beta hydrolase family protein, partial [Dokdonella sp.]|uniref:alpha/beta hydrolase family protein n=1 Tax=Dokdonella sp. TaxID=2291710 RepID=UPI003C6A7CB6